MTPTRWVLAALCAAGVLFGWWIMAALVESPPERPALVARIRSLPPLAQLPPVARGTPKLIDSLVSPAGPVWLLFESDPKAPPLLCKFPRESNGGVGAPLCKSAHRELSGLASRARLAEAGTPGVLVPGATAADGVRGLDAETGKPLSVKSAETGLTVDATPGTRLVRSFQQTLEAGLPALQQVSPKEAIYTGPLTGFAATHPPPAAPSRSESEDWTCATPAGYIEARLATKQAPSDGSSANIEVAFVSRGKVIAETRGRLPVDRGFVAPMACTATAAVFTWFHRGSLSELRCSPDGCQRARVEVGDIPEASLVALALAGDNTIVVWRDKQERALVRLGPLASFGQSPTAPLWQPQQSKATGWRLLRALPTGQSLLLFVQALGDPASVKALQIHADGRLQSLAPS